MDSTRDSRALALAGGAFFLLAAFFLWRDLPDARELIGVAAVAAAGVAAVMGWPRAFPALAPAVLLLATVAGAGWYLVERAPGILPMLGLAVPASAIALLRAEGEGGPPFAPSVAHRLRWYALGVALLAATWGLYFNFLTIGFAADSVARRLVLTLTWLALGLGFFVPGRTRTASTGAVHVGFVLGAAALGKAAFYDTTHLHGLLRVLVLAAVAALLFSASRIMRRPAAAAAAGRAA